MCDSQPSISVEALEHSHTQVNVLSPLPSVSNHLFITFKCNLDKSVFDIDPTKEYYSFMKTFLN